MKGTRAGLLDWDMENDKVFYSPQWKSMLGYTEDEIENTFDGWKKLWHPDEVQRIEQAFTDYLAGKTEIYEIDHRLRCRILSEDEAVVEIEKNAGAQFDPDITRVFVEKVLPEIRRKNPAK